MEYAFPGRQKGWLVRRLFSGDFKFLLLVKFRGKSQGRSYMVDEEENVFENVNWDE